MNAHAQRSHSRLAPSASARWLNCPGSEYLIRKLGLDKERTTSPYAELGTAAAELLETCLSLDMPPESFRGETFNGEHVADTDMIEAVDVAYTYVQEKVAQGYECWPELEIPISAIGGKGHIDVGLWHPERKHLIPVDYKHGAGVPVEAEDNTQLMLYALGLIDSKCRGVERITLVIIQPRLRGDYEPVKEWDWSSGISRFEFQVKLRAKEIAEGSQEFHPGEKQCKWCDAKAHCKAYAERALHEARQEFGEVAQEDEPVLRCDDGRALPLDEAAKCMRAFSLIRDWMKAIEDRVTQALLAGEYVEDWKLVEGRSQRRWRDPEHVAECLAVLGFDEDEYAPRKLAGIGDVGKLFDKAEREEFLDTHTHKPTGKPTLAPSSDKRPAIEPGSHEQASDDFAELTE